MAAFPLAHACSYAGTNLLPEHDGTAAKLDVSVAASVTHPKWPLALGLNVHSRALIATTTMEESVMPAYEYVIELPAEDAPHRLELRPARSHLGGAAAAARCVFHSGDVERHCHGEFVLGLALPNYTAAGRNQQKIQIG